MIKKISLFAVMMILLSGCSEKESDITIESDYIGNSQEYNKIDIIEYNSEKEETERGNSNSNIANQAIATTDGEMIYFLNDRDDYSVYKMRPDGSDMTKLNDNDSSYMNVLGEYVYYCNEEHKICIR